MILPAPTLVNVASRMTAFALSMPNAVALAEPLDYGPDGRRRYRTLTFRQLDDDSTQIAAGLAAIGIAPGTRLALLVRPGVDFVTLVFALFKAGAVTILIDPGMGRGNLVRCLSEAEPEGFVAISMVHAIRVLMRGKFPASRFHVTVGRRWFWGGKTLDDLLAAPVGDFQPVRTAASDPAAIIFTTGSTGVPKGVLYTHGTFDAQVSEIRDYYGIEPGGVDLSCFPLFGLFNAAMGVTAVIPEMDATRPANVDPLKILEAIRDWNCTQSFGSPALWNRVGRFCQERGEKLPTLRRVFSAGAPVPADVLRWMMDCIAPGGDVYTPYGATEALPVASNSASEVLGETIHQTRKGRGVCVGGKFPGIRWKVIRIADGPIANLEYSEELPAGEIGELIVAGPVVTRKYFTRPEANALGKIAEGDVIWHRMGDVGYLDDRDRFWFCGRMAHRVTSPGGPMFTIPCEAIFNQHPAVYRSALVGVGEKGKQRPVIVLEPHKEQFPRTAQAREKLLAEIRELGRASPLTAGIDDFLLHPAFPVDIRHNAKIFREKLAVWAERQLRRKA